MSTFFFTPNKWQEIKYTIPINGFNPFWSRDSAPIAFSPFNIKKFFHFIIMSLCFIFLLKDLKLSMDSRNFGYFM